MNAGDEFIAPIIFFLENTLGGAPPRCPLYMASRNRFLPNNGLPAGTFLTFAYNTTSYNYAQLLQDSEDTPFTIWKFRVDFISGADVNGQMAEKYNMSKRESDGTIVESPLVPYEDLDQTISSAREFRFPVNIDSDRGLTFSLFPHTKLRFMVWSDKNASLTNKLMTGKAEHVFSKPFPLEAKNPYLVRIIYGENDISFIE